MLALVKLVSTVRTSRSVLTVTLLTAAAPRRDINFTDDENNWVALKEKLLRESNLQLKMSVEKEQENRGSQEWSQVYKFYKI